jgi:hypothetical protein
VELDDLVSTQSAVVATATAAVFSPRTRETLRRGAVLGVAGVLKAGDVVAGAARGIARGVRGEETAHPTDTGDGPAAPAPAPATRSRRTGTGTGPARSRSGTSATGGPGSAV